jgi:hypothetical protein
MQVYQRYLSLLAQHVVDVSPQLCSFVHTCAAAAARFLKPSRLHTNGVSAAGVSAALLDVCSATTYWMHPLLLCLVPLACIGNAGVSALPVAAGSACC